MSVIYICLLSVCVCVWGGGGGGVNASLLQTYIHGALGDMRHWYSQHFISHKHGMNEHTGKER